MWFFIVFIRRDECKQLIFVCIRLLWMNTFFTVTDGAIQSSMMRYCLSIPKYNGSTLWICDLFKQNSFASNFKDLKKMTISVRALVFSMTSFFSGGGEKFNFVNRLRSLKIISGQHALGEIVPDISRDLWFTSSDQGRLWNVILRKTPFPCLSLYPYSQAAQEWCMKIISKPMNFLSLWYTTLLYSVTRDIRRSSAVLTNVKQLRPLCYRFVGSIYR